MYGTGGKSCVYTCMFDIMVYTVFSYGQNISSRIFQGKRKNAFFLFGAEYIRWIYKPGTKGNLILLKIKIILKTEYK